MRCWLKIIKTPSRKRNTAKEHQKAGGADAPPAFFRFNFHDYLTAKG
jgi:hypothetical protein